MPGASDFYHDLLKNLPAAIYTCDAAGRITFFNSEAAALWGREPRLGEDLFSGALRQYRPDGSPLEPEHSPTAVTLRDGRSYRSTEVVIERPDGSRRHVLSQPDALYDDAGALVGAVNLLLDITDRKRAESFFAIQAESMRRLHELAMRLHEISRLDTALQAIVDTLVDVHGASHGLLTHFDERSGLLCEAASYRLDAQALEQLGMIRPEQDGGACGRAFATKARVVVTDTESDADFANWRDVARQIGFRAAHCTPIINRLGAVLGVVAVYFREPRTPTRLEEQLADMCAAHAAVAIERTHAEQALRESEARFRSMADHAPVLIWVNDLDGCEFVNRVYLEFVGAPFEQICGVRWTQFLHPDDVEPTLLAYRVAIERQETFEAEMRMRRADGEYRWMRSRAVPRYVDERFAGSIGCSVDITDIKGSQRALQEADRRKDEFLATLAHELRNPLAPLRTALDALRTRGARQDVAERLHAIMERQMHQLVRLVDDLLEVSRITRGKIELRPARVELGAVVRAACETSAPLIEANRQVLEVALPAEPLWLDADPVRLEQVFANLLNNAAKYTDAAGRITLSARKAHGRVEVSVRDTGVGIPADKLQDVFELFTQIDHTLGRSQGGLGIGLTLARSLVELHGGWIEARSDGPGRGSEFIVTLPLADPAGEAPSMADESWRWAPLPAIPVLVVDDNRDAADSLCALLRLRGVDARTAYDGRTALDEMSRSPVAVVLLDLGMPEMDGFEVATRIRAEERYKDVQLVAVTGWGQDQYRRKSRKHGFDHHLVKPVRIADLRAVLNHTARGARLGRD